MCFSLIKKIASFLESILTGYFPFKSPSIFQEQLQRGIITPVNFRKENILVGFIPTVSSSISNLQDFPTKLYDLDLEKICFLSSR
jgi:hypothetical protein